MDELVGTSEEQNTLTWKKVFMKLIESRKDKGPIFTVTIKCPFLGCAASFFLSHFSGNDLMWNILHGLLSWFYIAYRIAEHAAKVLQ